MGKEVKIGLAVIGTLLLVLIGVVAQKMMKDDKPAELAGSHDDDAVAPRSLPSMAAGESIDRVDDQIAGESSYPARRNTWVRPAATRHQADSDAGDTSDVPRTSYLPRSDAEDQSPDPSDDGALGGDPFHRRSLSNEAADSDVEAASAVESADEPRHRSNATRLKMIEPAEDEPTDENPQRQPRRLKHDADEEASADSGGDASDDASYDQTSSRGLRVAAHERDSSDRRSRFAADEEDETEVTAVRPNRKVPAKFEGAASRRVDVEDGQYKVQPNDNYWTISEKVYGTSGYFKALHEHNRDKCPTADKLQVGQLIAAPPVAVLEQEYPDLCPKQRNIPVSRNVPVVAGARHRSGAKTYVVEEGDTLFDIARYQLGKASRWAEIYDLNKEVLGEDFDFLQPGTELVLPATDREESDTVTRKRAATDRR